MPNDLDPAIVEAIVESETSDPVKLSKDLYKRFGQTVPVSRILTIWNTRIRRAKVEEAKDLAANSLTDKVGLIERMGRSLQEMFFADETLTLKEKLEVSRELRQWTDLGIRTSGLYDEEQDVLFVVGAEWSTRNDQG